MRPASGQVEVCILVFVPSQGPTQATFSLEPTLTSGQGHIQRGRQSCPSLRSYGPSDSPGRAFVRRDPAGLSHGDPSRAFKRRTSTGLRRAPAGLSDDGPRSDLIRRAQPSFQLADLIRLSYDGPKPDLHTAYPSRISNGWVVTWPDLRRSAPSTIFYTAGPTGLLNGGPYPGFHTADASQAFIRRAPARLSTCVPR